MVVQAERGESGTYHFQGFCIFGKKLRLTQLKKYPFGGNLMHWEKRQGTRDQARAYCMKEDSRQDGPVELGELPATNQGKRSDLARIAEMIHGGVSMSALYNDVTNASTLVRYGRHFDSYLSRLLQYRTRPVPRVHLCYGPTGCGKTSLVFNLDPGLYRVPIGNNVWFNGYTGEATILWDEFTGASSHCRLDYLLQIVDRYPVQMGTKGGHTSCLAQDIYFTTNVHPKLWYNWTNRESQFPALTRRFTRVLWWKSQLGEPLSLGRGDPGWPTFWQGPPVTEALAPPDLGVRVINGDPFNFYTCSTLVLFYTIR